MCTSYINIGQEQLHNLRGPVQNENVHWLLRSWRQWRQNIKRSMVPFWAGGLVWLPRSHACEAGPDAATTMVPCMVYWGKSCPLEKAWFSQKRGIAWLNQVNIDGSSDRKPDTKRYLLSFFVLVVGPWVEMSRNLCHWRVVVSTWCPPHKGRPETWIGSGLWPLRAINICKVDSLILYHFLGLFLYKCRESVIQQKYP